MNVTGSSIRRLLGVISFIALGPTLNSAVAGQADVFDSVAAILKEKQPTLTIDSISASPVEGLYEVLSNGDIFYTTRDGEYVIGGEIYQASDYKNLTALRKGALHLEKINAVPEDSMLVFGAKESARRHITVFTDISCGYCRKLHSEIDTLIQAGVSVRYLLYPRAGADSTAYDDLVSVWCAPDQQQAMTNAKAGGAIKPAVCENPVKDHMAVADSVGLSGTPLIYLDTGELVPGYRSANDLLSMLGVPN